MLRKSLAGVLNRARPALFSAGRIPFSRKAIKSISFNDRLGKLEDGLETTCLDEVNFNAERLGLYNGISSVSDSSKADLLEESQQQAKLKTEVVFSLMRNCLNEKDINLIIRSLGQYVSFPRVSRPQTVSVLKQIEKIFGPHRKTELEVLMAYLKGTDKDSEPFQRQCYNFEQMFVKNDQARGLIHPDKDLDLQYQASMLYVVRFLCANTSRLLLSGHRGENTEKRTLSQALNAVFGLLKSQGPVNVLSILKLPVDARLRKKDRSFTCSSEELATFKTDISEAVSIIQRLHADLGAHDPMIMRKFLDCLMLSINVSRNSRSYLRDMILDIRLILPQEKYHVFDYIVPFISKGTHTFESLFSENKPINDIEDSENEWDFACDDEDESQKAATLDELYSWNLQRENARIRTLIESRMRIGHVMIHDIDDLDSDGSTFGLTEDDDNRSDDVRERVAALGWNLVSLLSDKQYHRFFNRFLRYKLARVNNLSSDIFLRDCQEIFQTEISKILYPSLAQLHNDLSIETLTICRVRQRNSLKFVKFKGSIAHLDGQGNCIKQASFLPDSYCGMRWDPAKTVVYSNISKDAVAKDILDALSKIGEVESLVFYEIPEPKKILASTYAQKSPLEEGNANDKVQEEKQQDDFNQPVRLVNARLKLKELEDALEMETYYLHEKSEESLNARELKQIQSKISKLNNDITKQRRNVAKQEDTMQAREEKKIQMLAQRQKKKIEAGWEPKRNFVIAGDVKTDRIVVVRFNDKESRNKALSPALHIFGVIVKSSKEIRPMFGSDVKENLRLSLTNIPFCACVDEIFANINEALSCGNKESTDCFGLSGSFNTPPGSLITNGVLELELENEAEAAFVMEKIEDWLRINYEEKAEEEAADKPFHIRWCGIPRKRNNHLYV